MIQQHSGLWSSIRESDLFWWCNAVKWAARLCLSLTAAYTSKKSASMLDL